jgi:hypothetical protein
MAAFAVGCVLAGALWWYLWWLHGELNRADVTDLEDYRRSRRR